MCICSLIITTWAVFSIGKFFQECEFYKSITSMKLILWNLCTVGSHIQTPMCRFNGKVVQINEFVRISELSDKTHYLAS